MNEKIHHLFLPLWPLNPQCSTNNKDGEDGISHNLPNCKLNISLLNQESSTFKVILPLDMIHYRISSLYYNSLPLKRKYTFEDDIKSRIEIRIPLFMKSISLQSHQSGGGREQEVSSNS